MTQIKQTYKKDKYFQATKNKCEMTSCCENERKRPNIKVLNSQTKTKQMQKCF